MCLWFVNHKFQHKSKVQYHIQLKASPFCRCRWGSWLKATEKRVGPVLPSSVLALLILFHLLGFFQEEQVRKGVERIEHQNNNNNSNHLS